MYSLWPDGRTSATIAFGARSGIASAPKAEMSLSSSKSKTYARAVLDGVQEGEVLAAEVVPPQQPPRRERHRLLHRNREVDRARLAVGARRQRVRRRPLLVGGDDEAPARQRRHRAHGVRRFEDRRRRRPVAAAQLARRRRERRRRRRPRAAKLPRAVERAHTHRAEQRAARALGDAVRRPRGAGCCRRNCTADAERRERCDRRPVQEESAEREAGDERESRGANRRRRHRCWPLRRRRRPHSLSAPAERRLRPRSAGPRCGERRAAAAAGMADERGRGDARRVCVYMLSSRAVTGRRRRRRRRGRARGRAASRPSAAA